MKQRRFSRRVFYALIAALLWMGFLVDGTHAIFTDQARLAGNTITSGNADLLVSNSQNSSSTLWDKSRPGFTANLSPGQQFEKYFLLKNASDQGVDFKLSLAAAGEDPGNMMPQIRLTIYEVDADGNVGANQVTTILSALRNGVQTTNFVVPAGTTQRYKLVTKMEPSFNQEGSTVAYDLVFNAEQIIL